MQKMSVFPNRPITETGKNGDLMFLTVSGVRSGKIIVREGNAWNFVNHDLARSYAYRWGEEGIAGFCDSDQILCLAPAFWNGNDSILKERLFGLTNGEGNHGEDVKELYFHLDSSPTHSYCKFLYKYPQQAFPYLELLQKNKRSRLSSGI